MGAALLALLLALPTQVDDPGGAAAAADEPLADFFLEAADGTRHSLHAEQPGRTLTVLAFTGVECPITRKLAPRLGRLERQWRDRGVRFLGIDPNLQDSADEVARFARDAEIEFPILLDPQQRVTDRLAVERTTEVFLLDGDFRVVYRGAVDDQYAVGAARPAPLNDFLIAAMEAALAGETIDPDRTEAPGCLVGRLNRKDADADVTFHRDVAPLLIRHCAECHRPGQAGPMSLLDAETAAGFAPMIAEVTGSGRMPPWHASARFGRFHNERRLTETERRLLELWAASGAKLGDPADAPPAPRFPAGDWSIGAADGAPPDLIVELPEPQPIPATGVVPYRYVVVDPHLEQERFVDAIEIAPTAPETTHHVMVFLLEPGQSPQQALQSTASLEGRNHFAQHVPGGRPIVLQEGRARRLAAGARFLFQLHYTPNGKAATDRTRMALRFTRQSPTHLVTARTVMNMNFVIPPHAEAATVEASSVIVEPARLLSVMPHMHLRGKAFSVLLERHGEQRPLLEVPRFDFEWQHTYEFAEPIELRAGDAVRMVAVFDNSSANRANPDPGKSVRFGEQTFEEMAVAYLHLELPIAAAQGLRKP